MKKKKLKKKLKKLKKMINKINTKPVINTIGFQQSLRNDDDDNEFDGWGEISWVSAKKKR